MFLLINTKVYFMPKPPQLPKERRHRKRFSGEIREEDDTYKADEEITADGFVYHRRRDGSLYPKHTSIPVTESTRRIYAILRKEGCYNNYDELFLDIALSIVRNKSLPVSRLPDKSLSLSEDIVEILEHNVTQAKIDRGFKARARKKAVQKQRYHPRKIRTY
jgi:hypothetical protein